MSAVRAGNSRPSAPGAACCFRWSRTIGIRCGGMATSRTPASEFGVFTIVTIRGRSRLRRWRRCGSCGDGPARHVQPVEGPTRTSAGSCATCREQIEPHVAVWDTEHHFPDEVVRQIGDLGLPGGASNEPSTRGTSLAPTRRPRASSRSATGSPTVRPRSSRTRTKGPSPDHVVRSRVGRKGCDGRSQR